MRLFIDTEFIQTSSGFDFLSLGIVSDAGDQLYSERSLVDAKAVLAQHDNDFVRRHVLVQFNRFDGVPWSDLPAQLLAWLDQLGADELEVHYDFSADYFLIEQLLQRMERPPRARLIPANVSYLLDDADGKNAAASCWHALGATMGISQHHAFADAVALRVRVEAVHPWTPVVEEKVFEVDAAVTLLLPDFQLVHAETDHGGITLSLGEDTPGVRWQSLSVGQRLRCLIQTGRGTRVLRAEVVS
ncbi:MAG: hypothetical protein JF628_06770 [Sphingomonas sp.]|jgi:hypothetical protein|nr:hypothetical protein [Sphingomonas sp.]MBW8844160.1 hypothetical protein [Burkholderiales bacterium]